MEPWRTIRQWIERDGAAALVTVAKAEGSTPRDAGARMAVRRDGSISGSVGGGPLEWAAIDVARNLLTRGRCAEWKTVSLGPALDQCCGGRAEILHEAFSSEDLDWIVPLAQSEAGELALRGLRTGEDPYRRQIAKTPPDGTFAAASDHEILERIGEPPTRLLLFGAGHVGRAIITALSPLPFAIRWIDDRTEAFEGADLHGAQAVVSALPESELRDAPKGAFVLVMTHSHALDLALVAAALPDPRFPYVGLIGSATKRALFERRLAEFGVSAPAIERLVCPIGVRGISGKAPAAIAAAVTAELLIERERQKPGAGVRTELALG